MSGNYPGAQRFKETQRGVCWWEGRRHGRGKWGVPWSFSCFSATPPHWRWGSSSGTVSWPAAPPHIPPRPCGHRQRKMGDQPSLGCKCPTVILGYNWYLSIWFVLSHWITLCMATREYSASLRVFFLFFFFTKVIWGVCMRGELLENPAARKTLGTAWKKYFSWLRFHTTSLFWGAEYLFFRQNLSAKRTLVGSKVPFWWWWVEAAGTDEGVDCSEVYSCLSRADLRKCLDEKEHNTPDQGHIWNWIAEWKWGIMGRGRGAMKRVKNGCEPRLSTLPDLWQLVSQAFELGMEVFSCFPLVFGSKRYN